MEGVVGRDQIDSRLVDKRHPILLDVSQLEITTFQPQCPRLGSKEGVKLIGFKNISRYFDKTWHEIAYSRLKEKKREAPIRCSRERALQSLLQGSSWLLLQCLESLSTAQNARAVLGVLTVS